MRAVEDPDWDSIKAMFDHLLADERNRLPDLTALRQAIYRQPGMVDTMRHTLVLQDMQTRNRNLLTEDQWRSIKHPTLTIASGKDYRSMGSDPVSFQSWRIVAIIDGSCSATAAARSSVNGSRSSWATTWLTSPIRKAVWASTKLPVMDIARLGHADPAG